MLRGARLCSVAVVDGAWVRAASSCAYTEMLALSAGREASFREAALSVASGLAMIPCVMAGISCGGIDDEKAIGDVMILLHVLCRVHPTFALGDDCLDGIFHSFRGILICFQ